MAHDVLEGKWKQAKGEVQEQWGKLTDDDVDQIQGQRKQLVGKVQARYGKTKNEAEREVDSWIDSLG